LEFDSPSAVPVLGAAGGGHAAAPPRRGAAAALVAQRPAAAAPGGEGTHPAMAGPGKGCRNGKKPSKTHRFHFRQDCKLVERISVARVQPRTAKGITDLLLPQTSLR